MRFRPSSFRPFYTVLATFASGVVAAFATKAAQTAIAALAFSSISFLQCLAGPNDGAVLVVHVHGQVEMSTAAECGFQLPDECEDTQARVDGEDPAAFSVIAAFPYGSFPRMAGIVFGIYYDPAIHILDSVHCGDYGLTDDDWPQSGTGAAVTWSVAATAWLTEVYAFVGYAEQGGPAAFSTGPHPTQGGEIVDDSVIGQLDEIEAYGVLGFGVDGTVTCPAPNIMGACCLQSGLCIARNLEECESSGGTYQGDLAPCEPNPCPRGACCFFDGTCVFTIPYTCDRLDGEYQGDGTTCLTSMCIPPGACCSDAGQCRIESEAVCEELKWTFLGKETVCEPNPCPEPPIGSCCYDDGTCEILTSGDCARYEGHYGGNGSTCETASCEIPDRACCFAVGECRLLALGRCLELGGDPLEAGSVCEPGVCLTPCPPFDFAGRSKTTRPEPPRPTPFDAAARPGSVEGSPNRGGVLLVHVTESLVYTPDADYCGSSDLSACEEAVVRVERQDPVICHVLAAFGENAAPRMKAVEFGIEYDACVQLLNWETCADFEHQDFNWPATSSGTRLTWEFTQQSLLTEVYWFALSSYDERPGNFVLTPHPFWGGYFADDSVPSHQDPIAGYGALGFGLPGARPCPGPQAPIGACCYGVSECIILDEQSCVDSRGTYQGDEVPCEASPCRADMSGACCLREGGCYFTDFEFCSALRGEFLGTGIPCFPDPCGAGSACCFLDGSCAVLTEWGCEAADGIFQGEGTSCDPNLCPPPTPTIERSWGQIKSLYQQKRP